MAAITWDQAVDREYQSGVDRGVLYPPDASGVPWNGLTSVDEKFDDVERTPVYFDGMKINDLVAPGDFAATIKAVTYPPELSFFEGLGVFTTGIALGNQKPKPFGISYRTKIGNSLNDDLGYKIHVLYNVIAVPSSKTYETLTDSPNITEFEWDITTIPEEVTGYRPTAHVIFDSTEIDTGILTTLEETIYGTEAADPTIMTLSELLDAITP